MNYSNSFKFAFIFISLIFSVTDVAWPGEILPERRAKLRALMLIAGEDPNELDNILGLKRMMVPIKEESEEDE